MNEKPRNNRLVDQVAAQLQALVAERAISPGEKLPSERALCELLGVSRTVVREAVRSLAVKGLLDVRHGGGTRVRAPDPALVAELMGLVLRAGNVGVAFGHVQEARRLLEVEMAGLAAERHNAADLAQMHEQLRAMHEHEAHPEHWASADVAFHEAIATATHNPLYPIMLGSIAPLLLEVRRTGVALPGTPKLAEHHHSAILDCIAARDRSGARRAMQAHLRESERTFQRARVMRDTLRDALRDA